MIQSQGCRIELLGSARLLTGLPIVMVPLDEPVPVRVIIALLAEQYPILVGPIIDPQQGGLCLGFMFNRNGRDFLTSMAAIVSPGDQLFLIASIAGG